MNYYGAAEMAAAFRTVRRNTITTAEDIPEEQYGFRPAEGTRTVAQTLLHVALRPRLMEDLHFVLRIRDLGTFDFFGYLGKEAAEEQMGRSKAEILELLRTEGERFAQLLEDTAEEFLAEMVSYPEQMAQPPRSRFDMLISVKEHEMHHRGQLMVVQRLLGIKPHLTRRMEEFIAQQQASRAASR